MVKIYLARHGQDEDNAAGILNGRRDAPLTPLGLEQAKVLAQTIQDRNLDITKIYSSPLQRAYETAVIVADTLQIEIPQKTDLLIERDFGIMTGKHITEIETLCSSEIIKSDPIIYFLSPQEAETFPLLIERAKKILTWLNEINTDKNILLVCHGDIGKMLYATFYNLHWKDILIEFHFGNSEILLLSENTPIEERHVHKVEQHNH
ncbi:histidine phosphatase family protein [Patescibacteria group bacterium]|nr:histidine phosphatase family protein [Patescibacteria group bacterium]